MNGLHLKAAVAIMLYCATAQAAPRATYSLDEAIKMAVDLKGCNKKLISKIVSVDVRNANLPGMPGPALFVSPDTDADSSFANIFPLHGSIDKSQAVALIGKKMCVVPD